MSMSIANLFLNLRFLEGAFNQLLHCHYAQGVFVGGFQDYKRSHARVVGFFPTHHAQAPTVASLQAREVPVQARCDEVVAHGERKLQKLLCHHRANCVRPLVVFVGFAAARSKITCHWSGAARHQRLAK